MSGKHNAEIGLYGQTLNKLYRYTPTAGLSTEKLVECFIEEVFEGNFCEDLGGITEANAANLLRQMAMFKMGNEKKEQF